MSRLLDIIGATILLLFLSPFLILLAIWVVLDSPGAVLFRQERIGRGMRPFQIYKFRTMHSAEDGAIFQFKPRGVTRAGKQLRRAKLDELPQLLNVLRGEMSFVGPRPEIRKYVEMFRPEYEQLLTRRPGLTDPATLAYRHEAALLAADPDPENLYVTKILPDKLRLSRAYAQLRSATSDVMIVLRTIVALLR
jgi:lipopolysaccharide/colanic/teichoic acid biosynthesis glycosyltransferase